MILGDNDAALAIAAASAGAKVVHGMWNGPLERHEKAPGDFATSADLTAEQAILDLLLAHRPGDAVTGEESGPTGASDSGRRWLVDPLCGTVNYAAGHLLVAVNVALTKAGRTLVAASADPATGEVFWTDGDQAYVRQGDADTLLRPTAGTGLVDVNLDEPYRATPGYRGVGLLADPAFAARFRPRVVSSTLALAWVAAGRRAAYVTSGFMHESVHFAAGIALCEAAGGAMTDLAGEPLSARGTGLIAAADTATHAALLAMVRRQTRG
jgi:myo-inositol-1(or 4)-monophosphatase